MRFADVPHGDYSLRMAMKGNAGNGEGNGKRKKPNPGAPGVIVDHVKDENNDVAADIEDVKLFLKKNKANRIALKGNDQYPGGDFRSPECVEFLDSPARNSDNRRWDLKGRSTLANPAQI